MEGHAGFAQDNNIILPRNVYKLSLVSLNTNFFFCMHCPTSKIVLLALGSASVLLSASFKISFVVVVVKSFNNIITIPFQRSTSLQHIFSQS